MELLHQACRHTDAALSLRYELRTSRRLDSELLGKRAESLELPAATQWCCCSVWEEEEGEEEGEEQGEEGGSEARELH